MSAKSGPLGAMQLAADCENCSWWRDTGNYDADRVAARRHAEREGHTVRLETTRSWLVTGTERAHG